MKGSQLLLAFCVLGAPALAANVKDNANPLAKVLELMDSLAAKITAEGVAEEKAYKEYTAWCDDAATNKGFEIKTLTSSKAKLEATIGKETGEIDTSVSKIEELASGISTSESELKQATGIRSKESADFAASEAELVDTIDTIARAITIIEREMAKNPASFAQVDTSDMKNIVNALSTIVDAAAFSGKDKQKLLALAQQKDTEQDDDMELGAPAAAAYKGHSSGILDVLEDLKEKAEEELGELRKAEVAAKHNYEMTKQSLVDQIEADTKDLDDEKSSKASSEEAKATAEGDLAETIKGLKDAKDTLADANANCMQVAQDHEATVAARTEELKVIAEAKKVLSETSGGAVDQTYSFIQQNQQVMSSLHSGSDLAKKEVVTLVKKLAKEHHSAALAQLASRIQAVLRFGGESPFDKVKGLISDMIAKLEAEAGSEATEKGYCDEQMTKTQAKKEELSADISKLTAKIDKAAAASAGLKEDVKRVQGELAALAKAQAEMDTIRREQNGDYPQAKSDLEAGLAGVRKALSVLREYYGSSSASLVQDGQGLAAAMQQPAMPEAHSKAGGAGTSIIGILEVVESDFAKNLASEETQEADAASEYEKTTQENSVSKTMKEQDVKYSTQEFKSLDKSISEMSADRETTDTELQAVLEYFAHIKDRCIAKAETYESRKGRRTAEIEGLKQALTILEDETALVQRGKHGRHHHFLGL
jgi:chromosome segregation ATPase